MRFLVCALILIAASPDALAVKREAPIATVAEQSGFVRTGRYPEVEALCRHFAERYADAVRCIRFGVTPEGRPMQALVVSRSGALTAAAAKAAELPVILIQGGIHAGEIDGKDAGFLAIRELLDGKVGKGDLDKQVVVFVPVFNIDGHERFGRWNRPNQRGPEEMGWRTTAQNLNLNRDYVKADAPEMRAMLALVNEWDPIVYADLHVTDGAKFEHDVSIQIEPLHAGDSEMRSAGKVLSGALLGTLKAQGSLPLAFYPSFVKMDDPSSGIEDGVAPPRFSHGYFQLRNRFGMLVETHSWKNYKTRVRITRNVIVNLVAETAKHGKTWLQVADAADQRSSELAGSDVTLDWKAGPAARTVDFRGYAYTRTPSEVSGSLMTRYDENTPQVWKMPLRDDIVPDLVIKAPAGGYLVPVAYASQVAALLDTHGIRYQRKQATGVGLAVQVFRASEVELSAESVEGHQRATIKGQWTEESRDVPAGSLFVPVAQPKSRLLMTILEPQASDSMAAWGMFNNAFEAKEYMEPYVAEDVAREQLKDPAIAAEFMARLANEPDFAKSPQQRLQFFARRHSSRDERYQLYPVYRVASP